MGRPNDILIPPETAWLLDEHVQSVCRAISAQGAAVYFVGGCVRDALLGIPVSDLDMATNAKPEDVMRLAKAAGLGVVPTGVDHGTVTVVSAGIPFEVTTFRKDVETDGRRAVVAFSEHIEDDARRRDFTMNALYAAPDGHVLDPLNGYRDLMERRVRFIENATLRIREDYLRILRFFRFSAWYADPNLGFEGDVLDAIAQESQGLSGLSAERIGTEVRKLLSANDPSPAVAAMRVTGVLSIILPGADDVFLGPVVHLQSAIGTSDWVTRLAALGGENPQDRLRLSKRDARHLDLVKTEGWGVTPLHEVAYRHGETVAQAALVLRSALANSPITKSDLAPIELARDAVFPIIAKDLMPRFSGPELGAALARLKQAWIDSKFTLDRAGLLNQI